MRVRKIPHPQVSQSTNDVDVHTQAAGENEMCLRARINAGGCGCGERMLVFHSGVQTTRECLCLTTIYIKRDNKLPQHKSLD